MKVIKLYKLQTKTYNLYFRSRNMSLNKLNERFLAPYNILLNDKYRFATNIAGLINEIVKWEKLTSGNGN